MISAWRTLTLLVAVLSLGCFRNHGIDDLVDAGPGADAGRDAAFPDAPGCDFGEIAFVNELTCPDEAFVGETVEVRFEHASGGCCSSGSATARAVPEGPNRTRLEGDWVTCDCCELCDCIGPFQTDVLSIGPLAAGTHTVEAAGTRCTIEVRDETRSCSPMAPDTVRAPRVLFEGQPMAFSLVQTDAFGCDCDPTLRRVPEDAFTAELCDCCEFCMCVDPGYEVAYLGPRVETPPTVIDGITLPTEYRDLASCHGVPATGLRVEPPHERVLRDGPAIWWAVVSGVETVCCVEPYGGVRESLVGEVGQRLELYSCIQEDCDCVGSPAPFEAWHPLGELAPGGYLLHAGEHEVSFMVP
jgi:hypothetical protein